ncbi:mRNA decay activator protein ZFP36L1 [Gouania willdenowi]|uniref:mRNA decay activator protein ZFP36 n=1 Tax=Gouania willdenowi TaxID=441366 RepID=A0A8C5H9Y4_GOUWI|nr:mRNA decay activator protein ZFP36L1-like [Gouania willdenowi]
MPSYTLNQFTELEEMMCKHLLNLDLREPNRLLPSLNLAMRTTSTISEPRRNASLSCLSTDPTESVFLTSGSWAQQSQSPLPSQLGNGTQWERPTFPFQRSVSMVETSSSSGANMVWPGSDTMSLQGDTSPTPLSAGSPSVTSSSRYKTELCRSFTENGLCKYGGKCQFAHGTDELRDLGRHPKYKTELCRTFHTIGFCPYGTRCHFVHNSEEEKKPSFSRSSSFSSSSSSSSNVPQQLPLSSRPHRPPLLRQSFSFAGFPSAPLSAALPGLAPPANVSLTRAPSTSPPFCTDFTDLLSHTFQEMDSAFEACPAHQESSLTQAAAAADLESPFLPSPDSGLSQCGLSPSGSPSLMQSPVATGATSWALGARCQSYTSLSDQDQDGSSSTSSLSGSESGSGTNEANGRRLAVFSQFSVPEDTTELGLQSTQG